MFEHAQPGALIVEFSTIRPDVSAALGRLGLAHAKVRHPSYGGQAAFCDGIAAAYSLGGGSFANPPRLL